MVHSMYHLVKCFLSIKGGDLLQLGPNQILRVPMKRIVVEGYSDSEGFGKRLARLRKEAGYTLRGFATKIGISHRMLHFYESKGGNPSIQLLPIMAKTL